MSGTTRRGARAEFDLGVWRGHTWSAAFGSVPRVAGRGVSPALGHGVGGGVANAEDFTIPARAQAALGYGDAIGVTVRTGSGDNGRRRSDSAPPESRRCHRRRNLSEPLRE